MARKQRNTVPTSVILTHEQKAFIKGVAEKEERSFSHQLRFIVSSWVSFHSKKKERSHGKEGQETEKVAPESQ